MLRGTKKMALFARDITQLPSHISQTQSLWMPFFILLLQDKTD